MIQNWLQDAGATFLFFIETLRTFLTTRGNTAAIFEQMAHVLTRSISSVLFAGIFVGAIIVLQFNDILAQYDARSFLGGLNTSACIREVGPLIISFMLAGKIGAFTAAELGTMKVTEQIDAIRCLGTNPIQYLIVPRVLAIILSSLILLTLGLVVGILGSMVVAALLCDINPLQYAASVPRFVTIGTLFSGFFKSLIYSSIVAAVCCYQGYHTTGGARGVGRAVTQASVYTNLYIVIANFVTAQFLNAVRILWSSFTGEFT
jgi:phospholipid/cholesterol/gamma-HCH transport system permease protein